jgi:hypothetical protein
MACNGCEYQREQEGLKNGNVSGVAEVVGGKTKPPSAQPLSVLSYFLPSLGFSSLHCQSRDDPNTRVT